MKILAIETSCDETAAAVVEDGKTILSNIVSSSRDLQKKYGGVFPEQAAREQLKCIIPAIEEALNEAGSKYRKNNNQALDAINAIAVTIGPGLIGSLLIGVETAKTLSFVSKKPLIPVHHHLGHIYASWLTGENVPSFPAICLIVSGGHTLLLHMKDHGVFSIVGQTRDDAAGEAFDKTARLLEFPYPGGPEIDKAAKRSLERGGERRFTFPRPMIHSDDFDFSFSGLKTAVLRKIKELGIMNHELRIMDSHTELIQDLSASIQEAIVDVLVYKTIQAAKKYNVKSIIIGGGVAANSRLKEKFMIHGSSFMIHIPPPNLCTDNAAVIASGAFFNNNPVDWKTVNANPNLLLTDIINNPSARNV